MEAPPQIQFADFLTPKPGKESSNLIKEKRFKLKDEDEQIYDIILKLFEKSIYIEASNEKEIAKTNIFLINLFYQDFSKLNSFFNLFSKLEEIFELLEDMKVDEFKIIKNNSEFIEFCLLLEFRKKIIEIPVKLKISKNDMNNIVQNLCKIIQDLKENEILI